MQTYDLFKEQIGNIGGITIFATRYKMCHFREYINHNIDRIINSLSPWQSKYKIYAH